MYKLKSRINTETAKEIVKKKSKNELGKGTITISNIENTKPTTPKSVISLRALSDCLIFFIRFNPYNIF